MWPGFRTAKFQNGECICGSTKNAKGINRTSGRDSGRQNFKMVWG